MIFFKFTKRTVRVVTFLIIKSLFAFSHRIGTAFVGKMRNGQTRRSDPFDPDSMFKVDAV